LSSNNFPNALSRYGLSKNAFLMSFVNFSAVEPISEQINVYFLNPYEWHQIVGAKVPNADLPIPRDITQPN